MSYIQSDVDISRSHLRELPEAKPSPTRRLEAAPRRTAIERTTRVVPTPCRSFVVVSECCCTYSGQKDSKSAKERLGGLAAATAGRCSAMATQTAVSAAQIWRGGRCVEAIAVRSLAQDTPERLNKPAA